MLHGYQIRSLTLSRLTLRVQFGSLSLASCISFFKSQLILVATQTGLRAAPIRASSIVGGAVHVFYARASESIALSVLKARVTVYETIFTTKFNAA